MTGPFGMVVPVPNRRMGNNGIGPYFGRRFAPDYPNYPGSFFSGSLGIQPQLPTEAELYAHGKAMNRWPVKTGWLSYRTVNALGAGADAPTVEQVQMQALELLMVEEKKRTKYQLISTVSIATIAGLAIIGSIAAAVKALK